MNSNDGRKGRCSTPKRVVETHAQAKRGLFIAGAFMVAAVIAAIFGIGDSWWLPLHLFLVGSVLSAISATTQKLAVTWSSSPPPRSSIVQVQRWTLAFGVMVFVTGREIKQDWVLISGGTIVILSLILLSAILLWVRQSAGTKRFVPAIDAYIVAILAGIVGMSIGVILGSGHANGIEEQLRGTHLILNLFGLVGITIAGTLPYFVATQVRSKVSPLATQLAKRVTLVILSVAVLISVCGETLGKPELVSAGLFVYSFGLVLVLVMLPINKKSYRRYLRPRALQLLTGIAWWAGMTFMLGLAGVHWGQDRLILQTLVIGGFAQILVASLAYLGPVLRGGGHQLLAAGFLTTRSWISLIAGNVAGFASLLNSKLVLAITLTIWTIDIIVRTIFLVINKNVPEEVEWSDKL